jgi:hypothetical protein
MQVAAETRLFVFRSISVVRRQGSKQSVPPSGKPGFAVGGSSRTTDRWPLPFSNRVIYGKLELDATY